MIRVLNTSWDVLTAGACFALVASLLYLARKYRVKKLSGVFALFGVTFFAVGGRSLFSAVLWHYPEGWVFVCAGLFRSLAALTLTVCAYVTFRCAARAFVMFTELSRLEKRLGAEVAAGRGRLKDGEAMRLVLDMRRMAQDALSFAPPARRDGP